MDLLIIERRASQRSRVGLRITGTVQGVGFRPYVHRLARELSLAGFVGNDAQGVFVEAEGAGGDIAIFLRRLPLEAPPMAVVERIDTCSLAPRGTTEFTIATSDGTGARAVPVSPDAATCRACLRDMRDPRDRRYGYAFTNCTDCGPRYTIVRDVPYDRPATTMAMFAMCADCASEYHDPTDRRFHAQPVCCPACGPELTLVAVERGAVDGDPIRAAARLLRDGQVVAIKGLGGYHLGVDATNERAVATLRVRKQREQRPLAVMVADLDAARRLCAVSQREAELLTDVAAPIVVLRRADGETGVAPSVAPGTDRLGVMLAYTPVHHLLADAFGGPFVLTSGNLSDEPIAFDDDDARARLSGIADAFLTHDRPIHMRVDDSVARLVDDRPMLIRRARGYAPRPLRVPWRFPRPVLAVGAERKSTVCVAAEHHATLSHHIGDLENWETFQSFTQAIAHLCRLFDIEPAVVAHDLHPEYLSTKHALELHGVDLVGVQHHHAHIASCLADNDEAGPVIGIAFDGTGYGTDGTIWGGEVLVADLASSERVGHLQTVPLPGGAAAIREPWRMAASWLQRTYGSHPPDGLGVVERHRDRWDQVLSVAAAGVNAPLTSSAGRLFDAVAALIGVRDVVAYEGQAAIELEQRADRDEHDGYPMTPLAGAPLRIGGSDLIRAVTADLLAGVPTATISARFHRAVATAIAEACVRVRESTGLDTVALSGGVFQNVLLVERTVALLRARTFRVLTHHRVPPNDGGISFGQAVVAAARDRAS